jgi:hypothetical protein
MTCQYNCLSTMIPWSVREKACILRSSASKSAMLCTSPSPQQNMFLLFLIYSLPSVASDVMLVRQALAWHLTLQSHDIQHRLRKVEGTHHDV